MVFYIKIKFINFYKDLNFFNKYPVKSSEFYLENAPLAELLNDGVIDQRRKESIFGIFGLAPISKLVKVPVQIPYDSMHLIFQGHGKWIYSAIFLDKNTGDNYMGK